MRAQCSDPVGAPTARRGMGVRWEFRWAPCEDSDCRAKRGEREREAQSAEQTWEQTRETLEHAHHSVDERSFDIPISSALGKEGIEPTYATVILLGVLKLRGKTFKAKTSLSVRGGKDIAACCLLFDLRQCLALSEELLRTDGGSRGRGEGEGNTWQ